MVFVGLTAYGFSRVVDDPRILSDQWGPMGPVDEHGAGEGGGRTLGEQVGLDDGNECRREVMWSGSRVGRGGAGRK
jgi:hypothetical protein